jgi:hypothetical protein
MEHPAGEADEVALRVDFDRRLKLEFHGGRITSDAGWLAYRELDDALGLTDVAGAALSECRRGKNTRHLLSGLLRQPVFGRLAGYADVNDADLVAQNLIRLAQFAVRGSPAPALSSDRAHRWSAQAVAHGPAPPGGPNLEGFRPYNQSSLRSRRSPPIQRRAPSHAPIPCGPHARGPQANISSMSFASP